MTEIESLKAELAAAREDAENAQRASYAAGWNESQAFHATALDAERVANAGLRAGVDKLLYGGLIASIGLNLRYVREDFEKMADALNALPALSAAPPLPMGALRAASVEDARRVVVELNDRIARLQRLHANDYPVEWARAGGPDECRHGYAAGVPCRSCDEAEEARLNTAPDTGLLIYGDRRASTFLKKLLSPAPASVPPAAAPQERAHCLVHDEGLPLQTCTCTAAAAPQEDVYQKEEIHAEVQKEAGRNRGDPIHSDDHQSGGGVRGRRHGEERKGGDGDRDTGGSTSRQPERLGHQGGQGGILPLQAGHLRGDVRAGLTAAAPQEQQGAAEMADITLCPRCGRPDPMFGNVKPTNATEQCWRRLLKAGNSVYVDTLCTAPASAASEPKAPPQEEKGTK